MTRRAYLGLGSNLGDRWAFLRLAVEHLPDVSRVSTVYETEPIGGPVGQGPYLNAVVEILTSLAAPALLDAAFAAEEAAGRERRVKDGPRTLDVDLLLVGDETHDLPELQVPHARMWGRRFVLVPLAELAPDLVPPPRLLAATGEVWPVGPLL